MLAGIRHLVAVAGLYRSRDLELRARTSTTALEVFGKTYDVSKYADISNAVRLLLQGDELFWSHDRHVGIEGTPRAKGECRGLRMLCTESKNRCVWVVKRLMSELAEAFRNHRQGGCVALIFLRTYPAVRLFFYALLLCPVSRIPHFDYDLPCCALIFIRTCPAVTLSFYALTLL